MKDLRVWLAILVLVSFLGGVSAGRMTSPRATELDRGPLADYEALLAARFELSAERRRYLRVILEEYQLEVQRLENEHLASWRSSMEPQLRRLGAEYNTYVRDRVLPPERRTEFDAQAQLVPSPVRPAANPQPPTAGADETD